MSELSKPFVFPKVNKDYPMYCSICRDSVKEGDICYLEDIDPGVGGRLLHSRCHSLQSNDEMSAIRGGYNLSRIFPCPKFCETDKESCDTCHEPVKEGEMCYVRDVSNLMNGKLVHAKCITLEVGNINTAVGHNLISMIENENETKS